MGVHSANKKCDTKIEKIQTDFKEAETQIIKDAINDHVALQKSIAEVSKNHQDNKVEAKAESVVIERRVIEYVEKNSDINSCTLPGDGVQLVGHMVRAANSGRDKGARSSD